MQDYQRRVHNSIEEIDPGDWQRLTERYGLYFCYEWQQYTQRINPNPVMIFALYEGDLLRAAACGYVVGAAAPAMYQPQQVLASELMIRPAQEQLLDDARTWLRDASVQGVPEALGRIREQIEPLVTPCLSISNGFNSRLLIDPALTPDSQSQARQALLSMIEQKAVELGCRSVAFLYAEEEEREQLAGRDFATARISAQTMLDTAPFASMEEYVAALKLKRRTEARREIKKFASAGFARRLTSMFDVAEDVAILEFYQLHKYGAARSVLDLVQEKWTLDELFGERLCVYTWTQDEKTVASSVCLPVGEVYQGLSVGFDYAETEAVFAYPNLVFYERIQYAIEHGLRYVDFGPETFEPKLMRGAQLIPLHACIRPLSPEGAARLPSWLRALDEHQQQYFNMLEERFADTLRTV